MLGIGIGIHLGMGARVPVPANDNTLDFSSAVNSFYLVLLEDF